MKKNKKTFKTILAVISLIFSISQIRAQAFYDSYHSSAGFTSSQGNAWTQINGYMSTCQDSVIAYTYASNYGFGVWNNSNYNVYVNGTFIGTYNGSKTLNLTAYKPVTSVQVNGTSSNNWTEAHLQVLVYMNASYAPVTPIVPTNTIMYCQNSTASALTATLTGTGTSLKWYTDSIGSNYSATAPTPATSSTGTFTFYVAQANSSGCESKRSKIYVQVNPRPTVSVNSGTICVGVNSNVTLTATGATTYTWNTNENSSSIVVSPGVTTNYTVTGSNGFGCTNTANTTVHVSNLPNVTATNATVCPGNTGTITASGANTYTWSNNSNSASIVLSPSSTTNYTVIGKNTYGCANTATSEIFVNSFSLPNVTVNNPAICIGKTATLTARGASTYTWNTNATTDIINVTPTTNTNYTVTGTDANGCRNSAVSAVTVNNLPTITANNATICAGNSATLTATGATSYTWSSGSTNNTTVVSPSAQTVYSVTGMDANGCLNNTRDTVKVNALPTVTLSKSIICRGVNDNSILTATAPTYTTLAYGVRTETATITLATNMSLTACMGSQYTSTNVTIPSSITPISSWIEFNGISSNGNDMSMVNVYGYYNNYNSYIPTTTLSTISLTNLQSGALYLTLRNNNSCIITNPVTISNISLVYTYTANYSYVANVPTTINWYSAYTGGTLLASNTNTLDAIGTSVLPNTSTSGNYDFYAEVSPISCRAKATISVSECGGTKLTYCNITTKNISYPLYADPVTGATQYQFKFYKTTDNSLVSTMTVPTRSMNLNTVTGVYYGNSYRWTVAVDKGTGFGPESVQSCTLTIAVPSLTVPCNNTVGNLSATILSSSSARISNYKFTFYDASTNALVATKTFTTNYLYLNQVPGLKYGKTYKYTVEGQYNNGTSTLYSTPSSSLCTLTITEPMTTLPCGKTYTATTTPYTTVPAIGGVTAYSVNVYNTSTNALVGSKTFTNTYIYIKQIPGVAYNNNYYWTVSCQYNNGTGLVYGPESNPTCTMRWGTLVARMFNNEEESASIEEKLEVLLYPNPNNGQFTLDLPKDGDVIIMDALGKEVLNSHFNSGKQELELSHVENGIYFINVVIGNERVVHKMIINH